MEIKNPSSRSCSCEDDVLNCQADELAKQEFEKPDAEPDKKYSKPSTVKTASTSKNHQSASASVNKKFGKRNTLCERSQQISSVLEVLELDEKTGQIPTPIVNDPGVIPDRSSNLKEDETNWKEFSLSTYGFPTSSTEEQRLDKNQKKTRKAAKSKSLSDFVREENIKFKKA
ncbi:unnamed protein product [Allacma fusca]|uniref:Uncharacterized protein n=1 Tax=Allacma fusca TaxID=39272 RepID=A0A8J2P686_9HEXA|nr:unnamed protein product [Allacma fusca]